MGAGEWISLGGFGFLILATLVKVVWLLAGIKMQVGTVAHKVENVCERLEHHADACDNEIVRIESKLSDHTRRIEFLESN